MNTNSRKRGAILVAAVAMIGSLLACSTSTFMSLREEPTTMPAKTLRPTFTSTPEPGMASAHTDTPAPDDVALGPGATAGTTSPPAPRTHTPASPAAGDTPLASDTPGNADLPAPTDSPAPAVTGAPGTMTPEPAASPTGQPSPTAAQDVQPSATPGPLSSWTGQVSSRAQDCGLTRLLGVTRDRNGGLAGNIWVHYWSDGGDSKWAVSFPMSFGSGPSLEDIEANWDGFISPYPLAGLWHVCVVDGNQSSNCLSNTVDVETSSDCNLGDQVIHITFLEN